MDHSFQQSLPPLQLVDGFWQGQFTLSAWAGFQARNGPYGQLSEDTPSEGRTKLSISTQGEPPQPPTPAQSAAFAHLLAAQIPLRDAILSAVARAYPDWQEDYGYDEADARELMPDIAQPNDLRALMGLSTVHILTTAYEGLAYVGFKFGCTWDEEHGLGALTHGGRVVEVGQADTTFLDWLAERDCRPGGASGS